MRVNRGKDLEAKFKQQLEGVKGVSIDRLPDPSSGFLGVRNIADFAMYKYPYQYYIECKAFSGNTLNFKSGITENQWQGMTEKSLIPGLMCGILIWFIDYDITAFVPIQQLNALKKYGHKSLNIKDIQEGNLEYIIMAGKKKRIFFDYEVHDFLKDLDYYTRDYWNKIERGMI